MQLCNPSRLAKTMEQFEQVIAQRSAVRNPQRSATTFGKFASFLLLASTLPLPGNAQISCGGNTLCVGAGQQYATIQAAANAAVAGQTVLVMDGTYAGFHSVNSGTPSAPITFKANSSNVIINSAGDSNGDCINIENTDYVIVDGFTLSGCPRAGIRSALSTGVIIRNNVVSNSGMWGIFTGFTPQIQILNNKTSGTAGQHGIYVSNSDVANDNPVIRGNESWGNAQNGIQLNGDCTTPDPNGYTDGIISGALIEANRVHDHGQKGFSLIGVQSSRIQNNIVYNNGLSGAAGGIHLAEQSGCNDPSSNNVIVNNTIVEPHIAGIRITTGTNNVLFNNIADSSQPIVDESGGPNAIDSASNIQTSSSSGLFVNPASFDLHLASGSIAIGAGLASYSGQSAPTTDYDGNTRPQGSRWDSGAYEYVATITCSYSLSASSASYSSSGGTGSVNVTSASGCSWTASSNASWITITAGSSGSGSGSVSYSVAANTSTSSRSGTLTIAGQTFTVTESGAACSYTLSASSASYSSSGGTGSVNVTSASGCSWTASSNASWITITAGSSGSGSGSVSYSVAANTSTSSWRVSPFSLSYAPDGSLLYINLTSGMTDIYPVTNGLAGSTLFATLPSPLGIDDNGPVISSDGLYIARPVDSADSGAGVQIFQKSGSSYLPLSTVTYGPYASFSASFDPYANHLAVALNGSGSTPPVTPVIFKRNGSTFSLLSGQPNVPFQDSYPYEHSLVAFSPDGAYLYATDEGSDDTGNNFRIYSVKGDTFTWLSGQPNVQPANPGPIAVSPTNTYIAISNTYSQPYLLIYKRSGNTFTLLPSPATPPSSQVTALTFTPDGQYLVVAESQYPFILAYQINATTDTFTALPKPALLPPAAFESLSSVTVTSK